MPANKAAVYIRVSTEAQAEEGYSIEAQKEMLSAYCVSKNIRNYEFYIDAGFSGSNIERPEIRRLIADAKSGLISHVVVYKLDRLSRSQKDTLYLIEDVFNPHGVDFVSMQESMDTSTPMGRLMLGILSAFAQLERENIRERTRMGMLERVKSGYWPGGGRIPFGYDYDTENGILVPNKDADTVRRIYELYIQGHSLGRIARLLGLRYEKLAHQILNRKSNCGFIIYNGVEYPGRHEPIISREIYEQAMQSQRERAQKGLRGSSGFLLTGIVYCGFCGAKMRYQKWGRRGHRLVCYSSDPSKPHLVKDPDCPQGKPWADDVEREVTSAMFRFGFDYGEEPAGEGIPVMQMLLKQQKQCGKKLERLYHLYGEGGDDLLLGAIESTKRELGRISAQIDAESERGIISGRAKKLRGQMQSIESAWQFMTPAERQGIARQLLRRVVVHDGRIDVDFNF
ncbi:MAG: recombinase family protein [Oscillospiraceae bacterium]|nr:recombinase family protein [Oscillospiraceae bacterium]